MKKSRNSSDRDKLACTAKIGEKGQIVIPKDIRDMFDLQPGDSIIILADKKQGIAIPPKNLLTDVASSVFDQSHNDVTEE